jgi:hypothetical protein
MAEHRASINALLSIYLVRKEFISPDDVALPTSVHQDFPMTFESQTEVKQAERGFKGNVDVGAGEGVFDTASGKKKWTAGKRA